MKSGPRFSDFELQIGRNTSGKLEVQILESPRDRPRSRFEPPFSSQAALDLLAALQSRVTRDIDRKPAPAGEPSPDLERVGGDFFASLFPGPLRATLDASLDRLAEDGLRLRLAFDLEDEDLAPFSALPWEVLYHPDRRRFLARHRQLALVRYLDLPVDIERFFVEPPLRVLLVAPDPEAPPDVESAPIQVGVEQEQIYQTLRELPGIEVERVQPPTLERLLECLDEKPAHAVHFMGHGGYSSESGEGGLFFEDLQKQEHYVTGAELAARLANSSPSLRLVVLNTCSSGVGRTKSGQKAFGSVSSALLRRGLLAVVAMQFEISDRAAIRFASSFYQCLVDTGHVEAAVSRARSELYRQERTSSEWITPVVWTRAANGRLFDPGTPPTGEEPVRVGIRSFFGWGVEIEDWSHAFLPLTRFFRGRYPVTEVTWREIYGHLEDFLSRFVGRSHKLHLDFAAHQSIAFATGYLIDAKAGIEITVTQRSARGKSYWRVDEEEPADAPSFKETLHPRGEGHEVAITVSCARPALGDVTHYVENYLPAVGTIVELTPATGPGMLSVTNGAHAFRLAEAISHVIYRLDQIENGESRQFHLFYAGPNGLLFFLGRLSRGPQRIQLYEFDFDGQGNRTYTPTLSFPVRRGSHDGQPSIA